MIPSPEYLKKMSEHEQRVLEAAERRRLEIEEQKRLEAEARMFFEAASVVEQEAAARGWATYVEAIGASAYASTWEKTSYRHKKAWVEVVRSFDRATPRP